MGATLQNAENGVKARRTEDDQTTAVGASKADPGFSPVIIRSAGPRSESRLNDRLARLLSQKKAQTR